MRPQDKRTSFNQTNSLTKLAKDRILQKTFSLNSGKTVKATHLVIPANEISTKTGIHPLNPRSQSSLTVDSVRDILPSIEVEGVHTEGLAQKNKEGIYLLLDSSRRRFCCLEADQALPLWVLDGEISNDDLQALIDTTQAVKRLSYRELGLGYLAIMQEQGFSKIEELAIHLGIGRETCRKRFSAALINAELIEAFPDCEGIPNSFYTKLAKIEKQLIKSELNVAQFLASVDHLALAKCLNVEEKQRTLLHLMESQLAAESKPTWQTQTLRNFVDKNTYAKISQSSDQRSLKIELSRLPKDIYEEIIEFVKQKVNS